MPVSSKRKSLELREKRGLTSPSGPLLDRAGRRGGYRAPSSGQVADRSGVVGGAVQKEGVPEGLRRFQLRHHEESQAEDVTYLYIRPDIRHPEEAEGGERRGYGPRSSGDKQRRLSSSRQETEPQAASANQRHAFDDGATATRHYQFIWSQSPESPGYHISAPPITISHARGTQPRLLLADTHPYPSTSFYTMSCVPVAEIDVIEACANCGKQGSDTVKLKDCTACRLVKYCGVDCQRAHRKQHKKACKQRAAELKDEQLYSRGHERPEGDFCSICTLPIPLHMNEHSVLNACCMKMICNGCHFAAQKRGHAGCPFCRSPFPGNDADTLAMVMTRVGKKDPDAIDYLAHKYFHGELGLQKDMQKANELWAEAAELGFIAAVSSLGSAHYRGDGVQQDMAEGAEFYKKAAMQGHVESRHNLGCYEWHRGNYGRALRHFLISAKMGYVGSLETIKSAFKVGLATKEQYAEALKGYQDALEEMKSQDRDEAMSFMRAKGWRHD
ncbi:hypothetical protein THAOC_29304 [Thalassiosira oceanica]|uniref:MYND-type domain-containing protein n=1 Tax=Thalassiosira oceanica TaxID=159749 RepID=K0RGT6_THAOC|nr:hypothetical protein THAOC_29304 [Thalassiosira oceanica]|eukprot:EJK51519.1 hypothetical protein THAOC_29304 [Thalassiosira oceanica]